MAEPYPEKIMVDQCYPYFKSRYSQVFLEAPVFSGSADMIIIDQSKIIAVEFKINDWQRALNQAQKHLLAVDYAYICIPMPKTAATRERIEKTAADSGVGLFYYNAAGKDKEPVFLAKPAPSSGRVWLTAKQNLLET
ncbi:MAG: hypothetical protein K6U80_14080, partial [Firmicutes bacterium]|nr:hypothetical protein [Bacillota bacterium]